MSGRDFPALVRGLINDALDDDPIRNLCFDHFRPVYNELSPAMSRTECIRRLVQWCVEHRAFDKLLTHAQDLNGAVYSKYAARVHAVPEDNDTRFRVRLSKRWPLRLVSCIPCRRCAQLRWPQAGAGSIASFWNDGPPGTMSLLGLGGAGKTAIAAEFLNKLLADSDKRPTALFVWSFYVNQDVNTFLDAA